MSKVSGLVSIMNSVPYPAQRDSCSQEINLPCPHPNPWRLQMHPLV